MINDKYHIQYYFMCLVRLSYQWQVSRRADPEIVCSGSSFPSPGLSGPLTQDVAVYSAADDAICCVIPLPRDRPLTPIKGRCGYSLTVVHFRKLRNSVKIGSHRNGYPVI